jgi:hypothetical protein
MRPLPHPAQSESVSAVHTAGQQPSRTVPLQVAPTHRSASAPSAPSTDASRPALGPTNPYVERWLVLALAVRIVASIAVESRDHAAPLATANRRSAGATGAMSAASYRYTNVTGIANVVPDGRTSNTGPSAPAGHASAGSIVNCTRTASAPGGISSVSL